MTELNPKLKEKKEPETLKSIYADISPILGIGAQLAATMVLMVFLGNWLDEKFGKQPLFVIICSAIGLSAGIYNLIRTVKEYEKKKK